MKAERAAVEVPDHAAGIPEHEQVVRVPARMVSILVTADAGGNAVLASQAWRDAGLPERGMIPVADVNRVRQALRERAAAT